MTAAFGRLRLLPLSSIREARMTTEAEFKTEPRRLTIDIEVSPDTDVEGAALLRLAGDERLAFQNSVLGDKSLHAFGPKTRREFRALAEYFEARDALRANPEVASFVNAVDNLKAALRMD